jgi:hypothetical protein
MAYRMQASVPELTDLASESQATLDLYGDAGDEVWQRLPTRC